VAEILILSRMWLLVLVAVAQSAVSSSSDDAAVRAVVQSYVNARELRDPAAIAALFTADADQLTTSGDWRRGRERLVPGTLESSKQNPGTRTITLSSVRFITRDVAIADGPYEISTGGRVRRMWTTIVLRREQDRWRIAAIRNAVPARVPVPAPVEK
jgi:uncharacterized protein (TIGR02246 family)